jgi:L-fuconolactonase
MRIDSHQHFWKFNPVQHAWINEEMSVIRKDFLPRDLKPVLDQNNINGCIAVQVDHSTDDTDFLLELAGQNHFIKGVVGWVDLKSAQLENELKSYKNNSTLKGFRHILQGQPKEEMLDPAFIKGVNTIGRLGFTYDLLIYHNQFADALNFLSQTHDCRIVIDHLGKPPIRSGEIAQWSKDVAAASSFKNVYCKLSGMVTEADWVRWKNDDLFPYIDSIFQSFGSKRIMYGSDWPVCLVAANYRQQLDVVTNYISRLSEEEQLDVMGRNAVRFYNLV